MRLLLDTHVAVWAVADLARLRTASAAMIEDGGNDVAVGMASLWEIAIKNNLGRAVRDPVGLSLAQAIEAFAEASFAILPIATRHLAEVERLPTIHLDPFDRLLVATARVDGFRLVTHDEILAAYGDHVMVV